MKEENDISNIHSKFQTHTSKNVLKVAILDTSFNLHVFSMEGWLPPPYPVTLMAYPKPWRNDQTIFAK